MASLEEQRIKTLHQGVSRQPDAVRLPGQVQEADNCLFSVVSGGFEKRMGSEYQTAIPEIGTSDVVAAHAYERDSTEQYWIFINAGIPIIYDSSGTAKTVNVDDGTRYLVFAQDSTVSPVTSSSGQISYPSSETQIDLTMTDLAGGLTVVVEGSATGAFGGEEVTMHTFTTNSSATVTIYPYIRTRTTVAGTGTHTITATFKDTTYLLNTTDPENGFAFTTLLDTTVIANKSVVCSIDNTTITTTIYGPSRSFADLPRAGESIPAYLGVYDVGSPANIWDTSDTGCNTGDIWKVSPDAFPEGYYFATLDRTGSVWFWEEIADPNAANSFDVATMPHVIVREADGTFTFKRGTYNSRPVGDATVTPNPDFIGAKVNDLTFHRNRLWFFADEIAYSSQAGDYFNFWPDQASVVTNSDPVGLVAATPEVSILRHAVPFAKSLFVTSDKTQFDISSGSAAVMSPENAVIDPTTNYKTEIKAQPLALADELYLAATTGQTSTILEYVLEDDQLFSKAVDTAIHVFGYLPANMIRLVGDAATSTLWCLSSDDRDALYTYRYYNNGTEKVQRAWGTWKFRTGARIHAMAFLNGYLSLIIRQPDNTTYMERLPVNITDGPSSHSTPVLLDQWAEVTGVYDAGTGLTTWTLPYAHGSSTDLAVILGAGFGTDDEGRQLTPTFTTTTAFTVSGDFSASTAIIGFNYTMLVELSKQYLRDSSDQTITTGRLQIKRLWVNYADTGFFQFKVTPTSRTARTFAMTGRVLGDAGNLIGRVPIVSGSQRFPVGSRGDTVKLEIINSTHLPSKITSVAWIGQFNELTRQE